VTKHSQRLRTEYRHRLPHILVRLPVLATCLFERNIIAEDVVYEYEVVHGARVVGVIDGLGLFSGWGGGGGGGGGVG
jgi:hypothetical protein